MRSFFGLFSGGEVRRVELALAEGYGDGKLEGKSEGIRDMIIRALRNRFPNENERFFSSCAEKLEKKDNDGLNVAFDKSMSCSDADEFVKTL